MTDTENDDVIRNPGGDAADAEADTHGDHLAKPTDVDYGSDDDPTESE